MAAIAAVQIEPKKRLLVASADPAIRNRAVSGYEHDDFTIEEAVGGADALAKLQVPGCESVILDRNLPDLDAAEVAASIRARYPRTTVEFIDSRLLAASKTDEIHGESTGSVKTTEPRPHPCLVQAETIPGMIGQARAMQKLYRLVRAVAPRKTTVLITGETGTGKELVAHAIHQLSERADQPFVVVNCAAIPETLLEAELFGHARGAFTGAVQSRPGRVQMAEGGTLFLDEVGELPLSMQAKLLRFLENGEVQQLGTSSLQSVDVRVVCATNVRLPDLVDEKRFRLDLYHRLAIFPLQLPPLRERMDDLNALASRFLAGLASENGSRKQLSQEALTVLHKSAWPGNVRELQHAIERAFILSGTEMQLRAEHFEPFGEDN